MQSVVTNNLKLDFGSLFERYSARTDGKVKIAERVVAQAGGSSKMHLLDLGAGDGRLTRMLAPQFLKTTAVDKKPVFEDKLARIPGVEVIVSPIEKLVIGEPFDIGLLSYSLSGIPRDILRKTVDRLFAQSSDTGRLLYVTYEDGCAWDRYADIVYSALGISRNGGSLRHAAELKSAGLEVKELDSFETLIWDSSLSELYDTLAFFFVSDVRTYMHQRREFTLHLQKFAQSNGDRRVSLPVVEKLFEIMRPAV